jgi:hypothetical protein
MVVRSYDKPGFTTHVMIGGPGNDEMVAGLRRGLEEDVLEEIEQEIIDPPVTLNRGQVPLGGY